jgi:hypothetical protein
MIEHIKSDHLRKQAKILRRDIFYYGVVGCISIYVVLFLSGFKFTPGWAFSLVAMAVMLYCQHKASRLSAEKTIIEAGIRGETLLRQELSRVLPDGWTVFYNVPIQGCGDIDAVAIGNGRVFVIEAKNHNGSITCDQNGWHREKNSALGVSYAGEFNDPTAQMNRNIIALKKFFRRADLENIWLNGIIVFTNKEVSLSLGKMPHNIKIVKLPKLGMVMSGASGESYDEERISKIIEMLENI